MEVVGNFTFPKHDNFLIERFIKGVDVSHLIKQYPLQISKEAIYTALDSPRFIENSKLSNSKKSNLQSINSHKLGD